jgi:hypothetical protein
MAETDLELARARALALQTQTRLRQQSPPRQASAFDAGMAQLSQMSQNPQVQQQEFVSGLDQLQARAGGDVSAFERMALRAADNIVGLDNGVQSFGETAANMMNTAGESATLGIVGDEASAVMDSTLGRGSYNDRLQVRRDQEQQFRDDRPGLALAADVGGALVGPATGAARLAMSGVSNAARLARGAGAGAAAGATMGFMEGEGGGLNRSVNGLVSGAIGGTLGAAVPAVADRVGRGVARLWQRANERPTVGLLRDIKNRAYQAVEDAGEAFEPDDMTSLAQRARQIANDDASYVQGEDRAVDAALTSLTRREGQNTTLSQLDNIRQGFWRRLKSNPDQVQLYDFIGAIDDLIETRSGASELMGLARAANSRFAQSELLDNAFQRARDQAESTGSGGNVANLYRQAVTRIINNRNQRKFFSSDQIDEMREFITDNGMQRAQRLVGKMSPSGNGLMLTLQAVAGTVSGGATIPLAIAGSIAKNGADNSVVRGAERVLDTAAGFSRQPTVSRNALAAGQAFVPIAEDTATQLQNTGPR